MRNRSTKYSINSCCTYIISNKHYQEFSENLPQSAGINVSSVDTMMNSLILIYTNHQNIENLQNTNKIHQSRK